MFSKMSDKINGEVANHCCISQSNNETTIKDVFFSNDQDIDDEVREFVEDFLCDEFEDFNNYNKKYLYELSNTILQNRIVIISN